MTGWDMIFVTLGILSPWVGLIVLVVVQGRSNERIGVLEREVAGLRDKMVGLTKDLGWKED
jgi:hypothetical protein